MNYKYNIALDAMGGDNAPKKVVEGLRIFLRENKETSLLYLEKKEKLRSVYKNAIFPKIKVYLSRIAKK